jgi:DNA-binding transcriptional LysR family regulator
VLATERNMDMIEDGIDIALRVGELKASNLIARPLLKYRHVLVASPDYLAAHDLPKHPDDLSAYRLITFGGWNEPVVWRLARQRKTLAVRVDPALTLNDYAGIQYATETGKGIAEMPSIICGPALKAGRLTEVLPAWRLPPTVLSAVYPSSRNISRIVRQFKDFSVEYIEQLAPYTGL